MSIAVVLAPTVMPVVARIRQQLPRHFVLPCLPARWRQLVEPLELVGLNPRLIVVYPDPRGDVPRRDQHHALADAIVANLFRYIIVHAHEYSPAFGVDVA